MKVFLTLMKQVVVLSTSRILCAMIELVYVRSESEPLFKRGTSAKSPQPNFRGKYFVLFALNISQCFEKFGMEKFR